MPLLHIFAVLHFSTSYLNYKWLFFTWHQTTFGFNEDVALYSIRLFKWAILIHMAMAMMMYTNKRVLTPKGYNTKQHYRPPGEPVSEFFRRRFDNSRALTVAIIMLILLFCYLFWATIIKTVLTILHLRKEKRKKEMEEDEEVRGGDAEADKYRKTGPKEDESDDFFRELSIRSLRYHYVRANKEYE